MNGIKVESFFHGARLTASHIVHKSPLSPNQKIMALHILKEKSKILPVGKYLIISAMIHCYQTQLIGGK